MAAYVKLFRSIWQDEDFRSLSASKQRTYMLLMSQPDVSHCGVLPYTPGRWGQLACDTDADSVRRDILGLTLPETLSGTLGRTVSPFVLVDDATEELLIRSYAKHDESYKVPNIRKALFRSIEAVLSVPLRCAVATLVETLCRTVDVTVPETLWPSQHQQPPPAASTSSQQQQPDRSPNGSTAPPLPAAAAAAIEIILGIRRTQAGARIQHPERWGTKTRPLLVAEYRERLLEHLAECKGECDARDLVAMCGFDVADIARAVRSAS